MAKIRCSVENCKFNSNCMCDAEEIKVCSCGCHDACTSSETACSTFAHR